MFIIYISYILTGAMFRDMFLGFQWILVREIGVQSASGIIVLFLFYFILFVLLHLLYL